jgi:hypothetical protein
LVGDDFRRDKFDDLFILTLLLNNKLEIAGECFNFGILFLLYELPDIPKNAGVDVRICWSIHVF